MFVKLDPPGSFCQYEALRDLLRGRGFKSFVDVGCGGGGVSKLFCSLGMRGVGIDFSDGAIHASGTALNREIAAGKYKLIKADATEFDQPISADLGISVMVMEHIADDVGFARKVASLVRPGGWVAFCVPGRRDRWSFEDETVGHMRRYDRGDLRAVLEAAGLSDVEVWSVAVPTANLLFNLGNFLARRSGEDAKRALAKSDQTKASGLREIPWKTTFPAFFRVILNRFTLYPLFAVQRLFYRSNFGVTVLGFGRVSDSGQGIAR